MSFSLLSDVWFSVGGKDIFRIGWISVSPGKWWVLLSHLSSKRSLHGLRAACSFVHFYWKWICTALCWEMEGSRVGHPHQGGDSWSEDLFPLVMHIIEAMQVTYRAASCFRNRMNILAILSKSENVQMFLWCCLFVFFPHTLPFRMKME